MPKSKLSMQRELLAITAEFMAIMVVSKSQATQKESYLFCQSAGLANKIRRAKTILAQLNLNAPDHAQIEHAISELDFYLSGLRAGLTINNEMYETPKQ